MEYTQYKKLANVTLGKTESRFSFKEFKVSGRVYWVKL